MSDENMHVMRQLLEEIWSKGDFSLLPELVDKNYVGHSTPKKTTLHGIKQYKQRIAMYKGPFPEIQFSIEDQFAAEGNVATCWTR